MEQHIPVHEGALGAGGGSTVEAHRLHRATVALFSTGTPLNRVALYTLTTRQWAKHRPTASTKLCTFPLLKTTPTLHWTPPSAATTHTRRSWCRCDAQHKRGTGKWLWLAALGRGEMTDRGLRVGGG